MMMSTAAQLATALAGLSGQYLIGRRHVAGFYAWLVSNSLLIAISLATGLYVLALLYTVLLAQTAWNIHCWNGAATGDGRVRQDIDGRLQALLGLALLGAVALQWWRPAYALLYLQVLGAGGTLLGGKWIGEMRTSGFLVWIMSNLAMIVAFGLKHLPVMVALQSGYLALCLWGLYHWCRQAPVSRPHPAP